MVQQIRSKTCPTEVEIFVLPSVYILNPKKNIPLKLQSFQISIAKTADIRWNNLFDYFFFISWRVNFVPRVPDLDICDFKAEDREIQEEGKQEKVEEI